MKILRRVSWRDSHSRDSQETTSIFAWFCEREGNAGAVPIVDVSVVLTTYNRANLLERALRSVLSQTHEDLELIVVDDASTDETPAVVESVDDDRLSYERHEENKGLSTARNTGIAAAQAELVAFLDDDDVWKPRKLQKQVTEIRDAEPRVALVYCWMDEYSGECRVGQTRPTLRGNLFDRSLRSQPITNGSTWLVRREVLKELGGFDEDMPRGVDGDFIRRYFHAGYEVDYVAETLVNYYVDHPYDRITNAREDGIRNAIRGESVKFEKFPDELAVRPRTAAHVHTKLAHQYARLGDVRGFLRHACKGIRVSPRYRENYVRGLRSLRALVSQHV